MGAGASAAVDEPFDELAAFKVLVKEYEKRGKLLTDQEEGFKALKELWLKLSRGEEVEDTTTLVEKLGHVAFKEHRQGVIDAVFRLQATRKKEESLKEGENYVIEGVTYNTAADAAAEREFASVLIGHDGGHHTSEDKDQGYVTLNSAEEANARDGMWERVNADPVFYVSLSHPPPQLCSKRALTPTTAPPPTITHTTAAADQRSHGRDLLPATRQCEQEAG